MKKSVKIFLRPALEELISSRGLDEVRAGAER